MSWFESVQKIITELAIANKDELFVGVSLLIIGLVISLAAWVYQKLWSVKKIETGTPSDKSKTTIQHYHGITLPEYEQGLKSREHDVTARLTTAHDAEKVVFNAELAEIKQQRENIEASYETYITQLETRITELKAMQQSHPLLQEQLEQAIIALKQGDSKQADTLLANIEKDSEDTISTLAQVAFQRANIANNEIRYLDALTHLKRAAQLAPNNTTYLNMLGVIQFTLGQHQQAINSFELVLTSDLSNYDENYPEVAIDRNNLGCVWKALGEYQKAIELFELALTSNLSTYGENHPQVATDRNNLGSAWKALGGHQKAIELYQLALISDLATYGETHPKVAIERSNLGVAWKALGEYQKAIELYQLALTSHLATYGENHPQVATDRNNLGSIWEALGEYQKAIELFELALTSDLATYGENHPQVALYRNNLGSAWLGLGEYQKAIELYQLALITLKKTFGENHTHTKIATGNLANAKKELQQVKSN